MYFKTMKLLLKTIFERFNSYKLNIPSSRRAMFDWVRGWGCGFIPLQYYRGKKNASFLVLIIPNGGLYFLS